MSEPRADLLLRRAELVEKKREIETQLSSDKNDMLEDRADYIEQGLGTQEAVIKATAGGDLDWRRRAIFALKCTERELAQANAEIRKISGSSSVRIADVFRGSADELAEYLNELPGMVYSMVHIDGATVILHS